MFVASRHRLLSRGGAFLAGLLWSVASVADLDIPDSPLFLTSVGVKPNLVMTIDDSASMMSAYLPESLYTGCGSGSNCKDGVSVAGTSRFKSAYFNPMYYNPLVTYSIPRRPDKTYTTSYAAAKRNGFDNSQDSAKLNFDNSQYRAQIHYTNGTGAKDTTWETSNVAPYYYVFYLQIGASRPNNCTANDKNDDDCYIKKLVGDSTGADADIYDGTPTEQKQNFANWYSFYRTRALATMSAAMDAMGQVELNSLRFAWQTLNCTNPNNNCCHSFSPSSCRARDGVSRDNRIRRFDDGHRKNFLNWLENAAPPSSAGTPLRSALQRVGNYFDHSVTSGAASPYAEDPPDLLGTERSCRRNFHLMMTDGIWNGSLSGGPGNIDGTTSTIQMPDDIFSYTKKYPYRDTNENSLADLAFYYWSKDLRQGSQDNSTVCSGAACNNVPTYFADRSGDDETNYWNPKNDPATWQHMTNYMVGLGLGATLTNPAWAGSTFAGDYLALASGTKSWPNINVSSDDPNKVYDLWHAAINSRGRFFSADDPQTLSAAFREILDTISSIAASGGGAGLGSNTTQTTGTDGVVFEAKFNDDWSGMLLARPIDSFVESETEDPDEPEAPKCENDICWDAGQLIPAPEARNIFTINKVPEPFTSCSDDILTKLTKIVDGKPDGLCTKRLHWLRGDGRVQGISSSYDAETDIVTATFRVPDHGFDTGDSVTIDDVEIAPQSPPAAGYNGTYKITKTGPDTFTAQIPSATGVLGTYVGGGRARYTPFRDRQNSVLGDIVNSDPVYAAGEDLGYAGGSIKVNGAGEDYESYLKDTKGKRLPMLYVGANDGMLHGFRADIGEEGSGTELFAYVPRGVYDNLSALTDPGYTHKFYVDGPLSVGDAYLGEWGTYLVGGLGAGGRSIFALDVSRPDNFLKDDVLWEYPYTTGTTDTDLGLTYSRPQIAAITPERWAVIFGNGYNSVSGDAYLYVVDLATGGLIDKVPTNSGPDNGLSTPHLYDSDGNGVMDVAYAGDLKGNLWKFVNNGGKWSLGNGRAPLFTASNDDNDVQPITSEPKVAKLPKHGGVLVYFGTGSYLSTTDLGKVDDVETFDDVQSFYAIWDRTGLDPEETQGTAVRGKMAGYRILGTQTIPRTPTPDNPETALTVRTTSAGEVNWDPEQGPLDQGWYLDLPETPGLPSERIVSTPIVMQFNSESVPDRILFVTNTPEDDPCSRGGTTWLMELDLYTGGRTATSVFDFSGDRDFNEQDLVNFGGDLGSQTASGIALPTTYGITGEPLLLTNPDGDIIKLFSGSTGVSGTAGGPLQQGEPPPPPENPGGIERIYWKQIL